MRHALFTITNTNSPGGFGGVATWIERVTQALPQYGWSVTTVTHAIDPDHLADWSGVHPGIAMRPLFGRFARIDQIEPALERYLDSERPDLVVVNGSYWMMPTIQRRKQRGDAIRVIGVAHADSNAYYAALGFFRDCFDHVIGVSQRCYQTLLGLGYPSDRASLLPYGVPCPPEPPARIGDGPLRVAYVGRLVQAQKRILDFVPLVRTLNQRSVDYRLDFYGSGEQENELRAKLAEIDGAGRVRFHGWVASHEIVDRVWPNADVLVLLSEYEGLSVAMVEAMAHGTVPVVSRIESGVGDVIRDGETGYSFDVGDVEGCADRIALLGEDRRRLEQMSRAAHEVVNQGYSLAVHARRLAAILDATMERPPQMESASYFMGVSSRPVARLLPGWLLTGARRLLRRGDPSGEGYAFFR